MTSTRLALAFLAFAGLLAETAYAADDPPAGGEQRAMKRFERLDKDQSGGITFEEFSAALHMRVNDADANHDGKITTEELTAAFERMRAKRMAERLMRRFDDNGDGVLTADEIETRHKRMFARLDKNGDGKLDPDEMPKRRGMRRGMGGPGMGQGGVPGLDPDDGQQ